MKELIIMIEHIVFTGSAVLLLAALLGVELGLVTWLFINKPKKDEVIVEVVINEQPLDKEAQQWAAYNRFNEKK